MSHFGVFAGSVEGLDPQVLLDPLEEQFDLQRHWRVEFPLALTDFSGTPPAFWYALLRL